MVLLPALRYSVIPDSASLTESIQQLSKIKEFSETLMKNPYLSDRFLA